MTPREHNTALLIAGTTPYFLERGPLWFSEHAAAIRRKSRSDPWWRDHTLWLEVGARAPLSPLLRSLDELGYARTGRVGRPGEMAARGGIVDVFPINRERPVRIEFSGSVIEALIELPATGAERSRPPKLKDPSAYERTWLGDLLPGDYVVHRDHGIGIFRGIITGPPGRTEYFHVEYALPRPGASPDRLLVPRRLSEKLSRYIGFHTPAIQRLGGPGWETTKRRTREDVRQLAAELVGMFRARARTRRAPYPPAPDIEAELARTFPYPFTPDQTAALDDIHRDLSADRPMDRLLVGDVGFGKTELAVRAAGRAAWSGRQALVLVPTTILADQHLDTFADRLAPLGIAVAGLSRLTPPRELSRLLASLPAGRTDVVIGTQRSLSRDVRWKNLGLVVVDEEQRFGVRTKEMLKGMRTEADILSLTATPIPRTLSLALAKLRDVSLVQTPPPGRSAPRTFVLPFSRRTVAEAIAAEVSRGGQVFYLWNRIDTIARAREEIIRLAPRTRSALLHGRMSEREIVAAMRAFRAGGIDLLVATASSTTAYFLYPPRRMTPTAAERLEALGRARELGSGFALALRDLEIRGAGNVLGREQSGAANRVGLNLYAQLLTEALEELS